MFNRHAALIALGALLLLSASGWAVPVVAADGKPLEIKLNRHKIVVVGGRENLQSAEFAKPGDVLEEVAIYTNTTERSLAGVEATLPVPLNTNLILKSVKPGAARASVDGATFAPIPLRRKVKLANGSTVEQSVPVGEYRFLRWYPGKLDARQAVSFSARFKVNDEQSNAVTANGEPLAR